jgi:uncharacterized protein (TIGR02391 family)
MAKIVFKKKYTPFAQQHLEQIARILGDTDTGLKGSEIEHALASCKIPDVDPENTKWKRLYNAFVAFQNEHQVGNHVIVFIHHVMNPASYTEKPEEFAERKDHLNRVLAFSGMELCDTGKLRHVSKAENLDDALQRAARLKAILEQREVHQHVLEHCRAEVLQDNYFHAVLEAMKSITTRIRALSGLDGDGAELVDAVFGGSSPKLTINTFDTKSRRGEQRGFASLLKGLYGMVRNPIAHEAKIEWEMTEQDAVDILTTISLVHRKIDNAESGDSKA